MNNKKDIDNIVSVTYNSRIDNKTAHHREEEKMKEQRTRRNIMEAASNEGGKSVTLQLTTHGYTADETAEMEKKFEGFWEETKRLLNLKDLTRDKVEAAAMKRD